VSPLRNRRRLRLPRRPTRSPLRAAGVTDEVKIPIEKLVPDAVFDVPGVPIG
jgi:hypothetical protein